MNNQQKCVGVSQFKPPCDSVNHFLNAVRLQPGKFSCAIDCFLELWHSILRHHFSEPSESRLIMLAQNMSAYCSYLSAHLCTERNLDAARAHVWDYLRETCPPPTPMDCNAQFSEIFTTNVFCDLNALEKSKVTSIFSSIEFCLTDAINKTSVTQKSL